MRHLSDVRAVMDGDAKFPKTKPTPVAPDIKADPFARPARDEADENRPREGYTFDPVEPIPEHMQPPPPPPRKRFALRDRDSSDDAFNLKIAAYTFIAASSASGGAALAFGPYVAGIVFWATWIITFASAKFMAGRAGTAAASIYFPGTSTPGDRQYSLAQSFVVRGQFEKAAAEYARNAAQFPDDPEPCMRLARLFRDDLQRYDDAITWFKHVIAIPEVQPGTEMMALREMIEVYTHRKREPRAAAPHLARLAAKHPNTPAGDWAKRELAEMKAQMREDEA